MMMMKMAVMILFILTLGSAAVRKDDTIFHSTDGTTSN